MKKLYSLLFILSIICSFHLNAQKARHHSNLIKKESLSQYSQATFASGCFWCMEAVFESVNGVKEAVSGYSGGKEPNPTYEQVGDHKTGHAESVQVYYDPSVVTYATLLKVYFGSEDPTQVNGQGPDHGSPYRSIIFYRTPEEKAQAEKYVAEIQKNYSKPIAAMIPDMIW